MSSNVIIAFIDPKDLQAMGPMRGCLDAKHTIKIVTSTVNYLTQVRDVCKKIGTTKVIVSTQTLLQKLVQKVYPDYPDQATINDFRGSLFQWEGIEFLILPPARAFFYEPSMSYLCRRWLQKLTNPDFPDFPELIWEELYSGNIEEFLSLADKALLVAVDIETANRAIKPELTKDFRMRGLWSMGAEKKGSKKILPVVPLITMVGYTLLLYSEKSGYYSFTGVLTISSFEDIENMRKINNTKAPKVMQNGGYDSSYFLRYAAPLHNYIYDTFIAMHSWYAELPRKLGFIASLFNRTHIYWKDEADMNVVEYCAKDCHNTLWSWIFIIQQWPDWAAANYEENFRMQFPCISCGIEGFKVNENQLREHAENRKRDINEIQRRLGKIVWPDFNADSSKQVLMLMKGMGFKKATNSDDKTLTKFREMNSIFDVIGKMIQDYREHTKALSTYFSVKLLDGRLLYELNPGGTDTGRLASKASNFWVGTQIQNIPGYARDIAVADPGYELNAADISQSESRCTAYISEDQNLIKTVEAPADFHRTNCTLFFGLSFDQITDKIRTVGKRINHGANYNMGPFVLLETMGLKAVLEAQKLLKLPRGWNPMKVCEHLLSLFAKAYPDVKGKYYSEVIAEVQTTKKLVGATGWTRYCFGDPTQNKRSLNSYVAHAPQSLSVKVINAAFFDTWLELQMKRGIIRLKAQVHDELVWQCRPKYSEESAKWIKNRIEQPIEVRGRQMILPSTPVIGKTNWAQLK